MGTHGNLQKLRSARAYAQSTLDSLLDQIKTKKKYGWPTKDLEEDVPRLKKDIEELDKQIAKRKEK